MQVASLLYDNNWGNLHRSNLILADRVSSRFNIDISGLLLDRCIKFAAKPSVLDLASGSRFASQESRTVLSIVCVLKLWTVKACGCVPWFGFALSFF